MVTRRCRIRGALPESARKAIAIDGVMCEVRENLYWALFHIRKKEELLTIWVDALCINQGDVEERNIQVSRMGRTYEKAECVDVWLGLESADDVHASAYIGEMQGSVWSGTYDMNTKVGRLAWFKAHLSKWEYITVLRSRTYWTRLWVVQKFMLANNAHIYCGTMAINADDLTFVFRDIVSLCLSNTKQHVEMLEKLNSSSYLYLFTAQAISDMLEPAQDQKGNTPLLNLMSYIDHFSQCSETRLRMFALHSLSNSCCCCIAVPVNYSKSMLELCVRLLEHHLMKHGAKDFIHMMTRIPFGMWCAQSLDDMVEREVLIAGVSSRIVEPFRVTASGLSPI
jgi:hypothetical protein